MERRTIYLDLDDTVFNTSYFLEQATGWVVEHPKTIYDVFAETSDFFNMSAMLEYSKIPLNISVEDIKSLEEKYKVVVCTEYYTVTEIERKVSIMRDIFQIKDVIGIDRCYNRKYNLDLSDGILIDDTLEILVKSNAMVKIWFTKSPEIPKEGIVKVGGFVELYNELERLGCDI